MLKKLLARLAERKKAKLRLVKRAAASARLRLEVLEERLTPAPAPVFKLPPPNVE